MSLLVYQLAQWTTSDLLRSRILYANRLLFRAFCWS